MSSDGHESTRPGIPAARHPDGVPGDFYVENQCCTACGVPESLAPNLIGRSAGKYWHCVWKKQPRTPQEVDQAISILRAQELNCHRYAGTDPSILTRLDREVCDYPLPAPDSEPQHREVPPQFAFVGRESVLARIWRGLFPGRHKED